MNAHKTRTLYKKWMDAEEKYGDEETLKMVRLALLQTDTKHTTTLAYHILFQVKRRALGHAEVKEEQ